MSDHLRRITSVAPRPDYRLAISWDAGPSMIVSLGDLIEEGGVFEALRDKEKFSAVRVGERERAVVWPDPRDDHGYPIVEMDADALFERGMNQRFRTGVVRLVEAVQKLMAGDAHPA
jgi:hypothetical protein